MNALRRWTRGGRSPLSILALALLTVGFAACDDDSPTNVGSQTLADVVDDASNDLTTLRAALETAGLKATLDGEGPFTVFAPSDEAFGAVGDDVLAALLQPANAGLLEKILTYHVVSGVEARSTDLSDGQAVPTLLGEELTVGVSGGEVTVNDIPVVTPDVEASNGVAHIIDGVLIPSVDIVEVAVLNGFSTLVGLVREAELEETLKSDNNGDGWTVFAPTEEAFAALSTVPEGDALADVLTYHVVSGTVGSGDLSDGQVVTTVEGSTFTVSIDGSDVTLTDESGNSVSVVLTDVPAENGVIHVIDAVLQPTQPIATLTDRTPALSTLRAALEAGELVETLNGTGPFTVFAPVNDAFDAVGQDKLDILLAPENQALLQKVLTYHVLPGEVRAGDLTDGAMPTTVEGTPVTIDLSGDVPMVNAANITATDIEADNGVVHLIDAVLTENLDIVDVATLNGFSTLVDLVAEAGLESTLRSDNSGNGWTVFAPTNEAFAALSSVPTGQALVDVLTYHVVSGTVESGDLSDGQVVTTVEGSTFTVNIDGSEVTITDGSGNTVTVVLTDVPAANGVIHVIDEVILPS